MISMIKLRIGDTSPNGQITIIDEDRLCYLVKSVSKGAVGIRTISKTLLSEFVGYMRQHPAATANDARNALCGLTEVDKFEYGYASSLVTMAKMELGFEDVQQSSEGLTKQENQVLPLQQIFYGAPGTGKSYRIKEQLNSLNVPDENVFRTTFHPDSDYSTFVGCYKPIMKKQEERLRTNLSLEDLAQKLEEYSNDDEKKRIGGIQKFCLDYYKYIDGEYMKVNVSKLVELARLPDTYTVEINKYVKFCHQLPNQDDSKIIYAFCPQAFINAYVKAWNTKENVYLIIEEINRGNCAQIFGDLFQLLDRDKNGVSEYTIKADADLKAYLENELGEDANGIKDGELCLPSNLYIWATMNTSDQSLFPIDSAFKRRWDWEYEPIKYKNVDWVVKIGNTEYSWVSFQKEVNNRIFDATNSEDKMLGDFFVKPHDGIISEKLLLNKVLFYLWNDVCKDGDGDIFRTDDNKEVKFSDLYGENDTDILLSMMKHLGVTPLGGNTGKDDENDGKENEK